MTDIVEHLQNNKCVTLTFTKKDGTTRVMNCTLHPDIIPAVSGSSVDRPGMITVYDLEKEAWRTVTLPAEVISCS